MTISFLVYVTSNFIFSLWAVVHHSLWEGSMRGSRNLSILLCRIVSLLAVVYHSLWLGSDRSSSSDFLSISFSHFTWMFIFSVSGQLSTTVSERAPWGAQRVTFFFSISFSHFTWIFIFSLWAFVHHSLWGFDSYASLSSRLSGSPWKGYALPSTMFRSFDLCPSL